MRLQITANTLRRWLLTQWQITFACLGLMLLPSFSIYAQTHIIVARGEGNWPPYEMVENGKLTGFHIELIQTVAEQIDLSIEFQSYPWRRALQMAKRGQVDAITYLAKNQQRTQWFHFADSNVLSGTEHYFIKHKSREDVEFSGNIEQIVPFSVVHIAGYSFGTEFDQRTDILKTGVKDASEVVELIAKKRHDLGIISPVDLSGSEPNHRMENIAILTPPLHSTTVFLGFSKLSAHPEIYKQFSQAMKHYKQTEAYQALLKKYGLKL